MKHINTLLVLLLGLVSMHVKAACDVVANQSDNLHVVVLNNAGRNICLNQGTYNLGSNTLTVPMRTSIEGLGSSRDAVILRSSAETAISPEGNVVLKNFSLEGVNLTSNTFGILVYQKNNVTLWSLKVREFLINIGIHTSSQIDVSDTTMELNGRNNGIADPNLWITDSRDIRVNYGSVFGGNNGPGGDGEIASYNSTNVSINGTQIINSGAAGTYFVNCDYCSIRNAMINYAGEFGIDVVKGSDNFIADNNRISWANYGGIVFEERSSVNGVFTNNSYSYNNPGLDGCNGINVIGNPSNVYLSGNVELPPTTGLVCIKDYPPIN